MITERKITKEMVLTTVKEIIESVDLEFDGEVTAEDIIAYCNLTIEQLNSKREKAAKRRKKARKEGDAIREQVIAALTNEFQTREQITETIGDEDISIAKVGNRLTALVKAGLAEKEQIKVDGRKVMCYRLSGDVSDAQVDETVEE